MIIIQRQEIKCESLMYVNKSKVFRVKLLNLCESIAKNINIRTASEPEQERHERVEGTLKIICCFSLIYCNPAMLAFFQFWEAVKRKASCLQVSINHPSASSLRPLVIVRIISIKLH